MSSNEKQKPPPAGHGQYYPPPPPGPPPIQTGPAYPPRPSNQQAPHPDYAIPSYNLSHPQFAPPPSAVEEDIYNATPTDAHPPKWHDNDADAAEKKKPSRLSALGAAFTSKVSGPVNALAHKLGSEGFLPESMDKECEKAARILRGFCKDGIYSETAPAPNTPAPPPSTTTSGKPTTTTSSSTTTGTQPPAKKPPVLVTIPSKVIARAQGLAIFTAVRVGLHASGSSGSGILLARHPTTGRWSPPSGIRVTSVGAGFVAGADIYDCVVVLNTPAAVEMFTKTRLSLGSDLAVTAGPVGVGGAVDWGVGGASGSRGSSRPGSSSGPGAGLSAGGQGQGRPRSRGDGSGALTPDNTRFQTGAVPEHKQGMGSDEDDRRERKGRDDDKDRRSSASRKPVYSYVKSRGLFAGIQIDGTVIAEREGANERFYGRPVPVSQILRGEVPAQGPQGMWPVAARGLYEVLRGAEGWHGQQQGAPSSPGYGGPAGAAPGLSPYGGAGPTPQGYGATGYGAAGYSTTGSGPTGSGPTGSGPTGSGPTGSGPTGYGTSGYGTPGQGASGSYGAPGQGAPGYGAPGQTAPSYGPPGHGAPSYNTPAYATPPPNTGAPPSTWVSPPGTSGTVPGVTSGMQNLNVSGNRDGPSSSSSSSVPQGTGTGYIAPGSSKAAEAAADARRAEQFAPPPPPPTYSETHRDGGEDLPPAYEEGQGYRGAGGDSKTGRH